MLKRISASQLPDIDARRICLIKPSALGDVVQTLPLLGALRERFPQASISWVINRELADILRDHPYLDEIIPFNRRGLSGNWWRLGTELVRHLTDLRHQQFDLVLDLQGLLRTGIMAAATGAALRVGLESAREGSRLACHLTIPGTGRHIPAHQRYWRVAEAFGMTDSLPQTVVRVGADDMDWTRQKLAELGGSVMAVNPGARWMTKRWPVEKFAAVACKAMRLYGFSIVIMGSPAELDISMELENLLRKFTPAKPILNLTGQTTLKQLAGVLSSSQVLLTNDSGPMHLGAGLGTPVLGVFTCTSPILSGPPGDQHELVSTSVECAASYKKRCPNRGSRHLACMEELATDRVLQALERLVSKNGIVSRAA